MSDLKTQYIDDQVIGLKIRLRILQILKLVTLDVRFKKTIKPDNMMTTR